MLGRLACAHTPTLPVRGAASREARLVDRQTRIHLVRPGDRAALNVDRVGETGVLEKCQCLGGTNAGFAVQHYLLVLRQRRQSFTGTGCGPSGSARPPADA